MERLHGGARNPTQVRDREKDIAFHILLYPGAHKCLKRRG